MTSKRLRLTGALISMLFTAVCGVIYPYNGQDFRIEITKAHVHISILSVIIARGYLQLAVTSVGS